MGIRLFLHLFLLIYAIFISKTASILPFIVPVSVVCIAATSRNGNRDFDVIDMFWILFQLSFVLSPARTFYEADGSWLFSNGVITDFGVGKAIVYDRIHLVTLFVILFLVAVINFIILPAGQSSRDVKDKGVVVSLYVIALVFYGSFFWDVFLKGGISNVLSARHDKDRDIMSIFTIFSSSVFLASFWIATAQTMQERGARKFFYLAILVVPVAVIFNPFNAARFGIIQAWLPFVMIVLPVFRRFFVFCIVLVLGVIVVMPILSLTTRYGIDSEISNVSISHSGFLDFLDQHTVLLHLMEMVSRDGYQFGSSTLSVLLFFVPRALWPEKPVVIGLVVGEELFDRGVVGTPNLSGPIIADFYYDFGLVGVILGSIVTAILFRNLLKNGLVFNGVPIFSLAILSALPIVFRGSVGAVIGISAFSLVFCFVILKIFGKPRVQKK